MKIFDKINQTFGFTQTERRVVLVLLIAFIGGLGVKLYKTMYPTVPRFDYSAVDSEFAARSHAVLDSTIADGANDSTVSTIGSSMKRPNSSKSKIININMATKTELCELPGIGDVMAERILAYRNEHGLFKTTNDLLKVKGIGKKKFERLSPFIVVEK
jgi:comEA protein